MVQSSGSDSSVGDALEVEAPASCMVSHPVAGVGGMVELTATLRHMNARRSYRKHNGAYNPARLGVSVFLVILMLVACMIRDVIWASNGLVVSPCSPRGRGGRTSAATAAWRQRQLLEAARHCFEALKPCWPTACRTHATVAPVSPPGPT